MIMGVEGVLTFTGWKPGMRLNIVHCPNTPLFWVELRSPKGYVKILTLIISELSLFGNKVCRCDFFKTLEYVAS